jgi:hypothetical protein
MHPFPEPFPEPFPVDPFRCSFCKSLHAATTTAAGQKLLCAARCCTIFVCLTMPAAFPLKKLPAFLERLAENAFVLLARDA